MKKIFLLLFVSILSFHAYTVSAQSQTMGKTKRILIAYYSLKGEKRTKKGMVNLSCGFTEQMAMKIHGYVGGDMCHIENKLSYPKRYEIMKKVAKIEWKSGKRPELKPLPVNIDDYDVVFLGFPIWFGTFPPAMFTFLQQYDLSDKVIIPFSTSGATVWGHTLEILHGQYPDAVILEGLNLRSLKVDTSDKKINKWLKRLPIFTVN
ncbi:flavodoxin [Prevotella sp. OH937_COT-195]|uniref:flavodoxin n=1 Tax=Prevotella sp. OH937_COT-195 TaxID=2491051 RepID=UPI000F64DD3E|nr:flavodoxin [Prevotella sp. OH937_COT-195]RRD02018.1 flavodoxin [Prevotella sp. OH937_COT-195]